MFWMKYNFSVSASHPQLINVPEGLLPVNISAAPFHSVVVGLRGEVYTFGCGAYFRLVIDIIPSQVQIVIKFGRFFIIGSR